MATQTVDQTQRVRLAPFQEEFLSDIFASAKALTETGSQMPFAEQQLAGLSLGQQAAIANALQGVGAFAPFIQKGAEAVGQGIGALGTAQAQAAGAGIYGEDALRRRVAQSTPFGTNVGSSVLAPTTLRRGTSADPFSGAARGF